MKNAMKFTVHHVGARYGNSSFPELRQLDKGIVKILYDADADCISEAEQYNATSEAEVRVLPYCFSATCQSDVAFHINNDPFSSSLYKLNPEHGNKYSFVYGFDYPLKESFSVNRTVAIDTLTIDALFQSDPAPDFAAPDFLSLDVQGAEHDILQGAQHTLVENTVAVCLEVEFAQLYQGQATFGDICQLMDTLHFDFVRFTDIHEFSPHQGPVGTRSQGFHSYANAIFLRRIDSVIHGRSEEQASLMLYKLAFVALLNHQMEYALKCIENAFIPVAALVEKVESPPAYLALIQQITTAINGMPAYYPVSFAQVLASPNGKNYPDKTFFTHVYQLEKTAQYLFKQLQQQPKIYSALETVLINAGLNEQAHALWEKRVQQSLYIPELAADIIAQSQEDTAFFSALIPYLQRFTTHFNREKQPDSGAFLAHIDGLFTTTPNQPKQQFIYSLASYLKSQQNIAAAAPLFQQLLTLKQKTNEQSPQTGNICFHLGEIALKSGDSENAKSHFRQCLQMIPGHQKASEYLASSSMKEEGKGKSE